MLSLGEPLHKAFMGGTWSPGSFLGAMVSSNLVIRTLYSLLNEGPSGAAHHRWYSIISSPFKKMVIELFTNCSTLNYINRLREWRYQPTSGFDWNGFWRDRMLLMLSGSVTLRNTKEGKPKRLDGFVATVASFTFDANWSKSSPVVPMPLLKLLQ